MDDPELITKAAVFLFPCTEVILMQLVVQALATAAASVLLSSTAEDWQVAVAIASLCLATLYVVSVFIYLKRNIDKYLPYTSTRQRQATKAVADAEIAIERAQASGNQQGLKLAEQQLKNAQMQKSGLEQEDELARNRSSWFEEAEQRMAVQPNGDDKDDATPTYKEETDNSQATDLQSRSELELDMLCELQGQVVQDLLGERMDGIGGLLTAEVIVNPPIEVNPNQLEESDDKVVERIMAEPHAWEGGMDELYALGEPVYNTAAGSGTGASNAQSAQVSNASSDQAMATVRNQTTKPSNNQVSSALAQSAGHGGSAAEILRSAGCHDSTYPEDESDMPAKPKKRGLDIDGKWALPEGGYGRRFALTFRPWCVCILTLHRFYMHLCVHAGMRYIGRTIGVLLSFSTAAH